jgi:hypothetical protein
VQPTINPMSLIDTASPIFVLPLIKMYLFFFICFLFYINKYIKVYQKPNYFYLFIKNLFVEEIYITKMVYSVMVFVVEDTIQNGVLSTCDGTCGKATQVEDTIQNGVLSTCCSDSVMVRLI